MLLPAPCAQFVGGAQEVHPLQDFGSSVDNAYIIASFCNGQGMNFEVDSTNSSTFQTPDFGFHFEDFQHEFPHIFSTQLGPLQISRSTIAYVEIVASSDLVKTYAHYRKFTPVSFGFTASNSTMSAFWGRGTI